MTAGRILALDLSLTTGWAFGDLDARQPASGTWRLPPMADLGRCYAALENELDDAIALHRPTLVMAEAALDKQQTTARLLLGLAAHVQSTCYRHDVAYAEQPCTTMRKAVLGRGTFYETRRGGRHINGTANAKRAVLDWCHHQGWDDVLDHNEADALVAWTYAARELRTRATGKRYLVLAA